MSQAQAASSVFIGELSHSSSSKKVVEHRLGEQESLSLSSRHGKNGPLTVFARHRISPGKQDLFFQWVAEIDTVQRTKYDGYLGCEIVKPTCTAKVALDEYISVFRYKNYELLQQWMDSDDRLQMLDKTCDFEEEPIVISYHSLEFWFVPPETEKNAEQQLQQQQAKSNVKMPSRFKMALVTFLVIWFQAQFIIPYTIGYIPKLPQWAAQGLGTLVIVLLTTYVFMPICTRYLFYWCLFPPANDHRRNDKPATFTIKDGGNQYDDEESDKPATAMSVTHRGSSLQNNQDDDNGAEFKYGANGTVEVPDGQP